MTNPERPGPLSELLEVGVTRRRMMRYSAGAFAGLALPGVLAACGSDDSGGSTTTAAASGEAPTPSGTIDFFGWEGEDLTGVAPMEEFLKSQRG